MYLRAFHVVRSPGYVDLPGYRRQPQWVRGQQWHRRSGRHVRDRRPGRPGAREARRTRRSGSVANSGISGQGATSGSAAPGALVRVNSAGNGESAPYQPYSLTFADTLSSVKGDHYMKAGADVRVIRMATDQIGGVTYTYQNIGNFLNNVPQQIQYFGDLSEPSPFHNGVTGLKHTAQEYYVGFAQDEWRASEKVTLNFGLRYDYYTVMKEVDNRIVKFNVDTGFFAPGTQPVFQAQKQ